MTGIQGADSGANAEESAFSDVSIQDPILRLAIALHHYKGAYALLLGSGVSRSAGIPTGWEITLDLVRQLAASYGDHFEPGTEATWYEDKIGEAPTYDALLDQVSGFKVERSRILATYIEPTDDEAANGTKVPQEAHRAIARLVRDGYIRVIITTNFDQLVETALRTANVTPRVIATAEGVEQALPLVHEHCTIIKVHGDYTSGELKNTSEELATYDDRLNVLLERVFSDFGLIVCGWSAEWDGALRAVLVPNASRAFSTFWAVKGSLGGAAKDVIASRNGKAVIRIDDADSFFQTLEEKVAAVRDVLESEALTAAVAAATMKRYLVDPYANRIRIEDLVMAEVERVLPWLHDHVVVPTSSAGVGYFRQELPAFEDLCSSLIALFVVGCRWGEAEQHHVWSKALTRILNDSRDRAYELRWGGFWGYLETLLVCAGGTAAVEGGHFDTLLALETAPIADAVEGHMSAIEAIGRVYLQFNRIPTLAGRWHGHGSPLSYQMHEVLRQPLSLLLADDVTYDRAFDRFEYLQALLHVDAEREGGKTTVSWAPIGRFLSESRWRPDYNVVAVVDHEVNRDQAAWPPLQAGLFGGSLDRLRAAQEILVALMTRWR